MASTYAQSLEIIKLNSALYVSLYFFLFFFKVKIEDEKFEDFIFNFIFIFDIKLNYAKKLL